MTERLKQYIDELFKDTPKNKHYYDLKEEMYANLLDKYNDLIASGAAEQEAYNIAVDSIGDVNELIESLKASAIISPHLSNNDEKKKSALLVSCGVGLYIIGIVPILAMGDEKGIIFAFILWAIATVLLIYNGMTKPKYTRLDDTVVEQFKEFNANKKQPNKKMAAIASCVWTSATVLFLLSGFFLRNWYIAWILFPVAGLVIQIIKTVMEMGE